jgi:hypothetical protein
VCERKSAYTRPAKKKKKKKIIIIIKFHAPNYQLHTKFTLHRSMTNVAHHEVSY